MESFHCLTILVLYLFITMADGVVSVLTAIIVQLKLMSFVISWDTLELQATLDLDYSGVILVYHWSIMLSLSYLPINWSNVNCASSHYLSIAQCSYSTYIDSGCYYLSDATVYCCKIMKIII